MVQPEKMQQGGLKIVDVHSILHRGPTKVIGFSMHMTSPNATPGHEETESIRVMIAPRHSSTSHAIFPQWRASELTGPNDEGFIQQTSFLKISNEGRHGLIHTRGIVGQFGIEIGMVVP